MNHWLNLPNFLTVGRIFAIPGIVSLWWANLLGYALAVALIAFLTDFFDGKLARKLQQITPLGCILDPVADKLLVTSLFLLLAYEAIVPFAFFALVVLRNASQLLSIPILLWWKNISFKVKPKLIPKCATALSFVAIGLGFLQKIQGTHFQGLWTVFLVALGMMELYILVTFWPRFAQIYQGTHDTFE